MYIRITPEQLYTAMRNVGLADMKAKAAVYDLIVTTAGVPAASELAGGTFVEDRPVAAAGSYDAVDLSEDTPEVLEAPVKSSKSFKTVGKHSGRRVNFQAFGGTTEPLDPKALKPAAVQDEDEDDDV